MDTDNDLPKNVEKMLKIWGKEFKKGFFAYFILLFLKDKDMYGLELNKKLSEITNAMIPFQESGIYQILKNLKKNGMVIGEWKKSNKGPARNYYKISDSGKILLKEFTKSYVVPILNTSFSLVKEHFPDL